MSTMISAILPPGTAAAEAFGESATDPLHPEEASFIARAVTQRQQEFAAGRSLARRALVHLGCAPAAIPPGPNREPVWPEGIVGSISHCHGYCAAALDRSDTLLSIGIDAELDAPLPRDVIALVALEDERAWIDAQPAGEHRDRLLYSAKESVFKAWFPLTHQWLDFRSARVCFDSSKQTFHATVIGERCSRPKVILDSFDGCYVIRRGLILTAVVVASVSSTLWRR